MKIMVLVLCLVMFGGTAFAGVVDDAKKQMATEKQEAMVQKAKTLLEKKTKLESELAGVKEKLSKLDNGEDVDVPAESASFCSWTTVGTR